MAAFFAPEAFDPAPLRAAARGIALAETPEQAEILVVRRAAVDAALLQRCGRLRLVQRLGERHDRIDLGAAAERGIHVSCLPRPSLIRTAEHAILLMLALAKRLPAADAAARAGAPGGSPSSVAYNWPGMTGLGGLHGRTLGILGLGEVGALVARRAAAFGMRVLYTGRSRQPASVEAACGAAWRGLDALLAEADIVSLHASNLPANRGAIGARELGLMKPGALLVNTSRGALLDEAALLAALRKGRPGGAGLDVHAVEPRPQGDPLAMLPNVVLTPHIAGGSRLSVAEEVAQILANCHAVLAGGQPLHGRVLS
jgi:phosphoglycerate dehydrogenase-like enzyme